MTRRPVLTEVDLPDFGLPKAEPILDGPLHAARLAALEARMAAAGLDGLVVYGDREHLANLAWLTGYDPRFEEALCIVVPRKTPTLLAGNEGLPYSELAPLDLRRELWQPLSLMGQPRDRVKPLAAVLTDAGLRTGMRLGLAGWKGWEDEDGRYDDQWFETPAYLVDALRALGPLRNAADLFMNARDGLRIVNEVAQLARFEFAATLASSAVKNILLAARPGMSEFEAASHSRLNGFMQSIHMNFCTGPRARYGLPSPSARRMELGDPVALGQGLMGALSCRAGFLARGPGDLPVPIRDYVDRLVAPYFSAAVAWYETIGIGVAAGEVYDAVMAHVGDPFFGVGLNPGHYIHLDEWVHSPVKRGGRIAFRSGMALQCDIIPATGTDYFTSNIEDGIALLDAEGRAAFARLYPEAWARIEARRAFMTGVLGIRLKPEVLPFSNLAAWLPPFWLSPRYAMAMRDV